MSLVSYGYESSGESDEDDDKEVESVPAQKAPSTGNTDVAATALGLDLDSRDSPQPLGANDNEDFNISDDELDVTPALVLSGSGKDMTLESKKGIFSMLPAPKKQSYVIPEDDIQPIAKIDDKFNVVDKNETDEKDQEKAQGGLPRNLKHGLLSLPKPKFTVAEKFGDEETKQPVKISIPSLPDADSDDEEDGTSKKSSKIGPSKRGSTLLGLLPKPRHSVTFGVSNKNKPIEKKSNRILVPYTLSKKREVKPTEKKEGIKLLGTEYDGASDEDEPVSFFSLENKPSVADNTAESNVVKDNSHSASGTSTLTSITELYRPSEKAGLQKRSIPSSTSVASVNTNSNNKNATSLKLESLDGNSKVNSTNVNNSKFDKYSNISDSLSNNGNKNGKDNTTSRDRSHQTNAENGTYNSVTGAYLTDDVSGYDVTGPYGDSSVVGPYPAAEMPGGANAYANQWGYSSVASSAYGGQGYEQQDYQVEAASNQEWYQSQQSCNTDQIPLDEDALMKLQGKGKRKHRKEEISIIDISGDRVQGSSQEFLKNFTEETIHQPKKSKSEMPSHLQRRKHQITYLAFQAKEKEMELRNSWAANRQTRQQTQSKYGF